jgi:HK97 family phage portal protein
MGLGNGLKKVFRAGGEKSAVTPATLPGSGPFQYATYIQPQEILDWTASHMYRTQPHLRTVVSFLARNSAQCTLQAYARVSDTDRKRLTNSPSALLLGQPSPTMTEYELVYSLVSDLALFDNAYWWITRDASSPSGWRITQIPPEWIVGATYSDLWTPETWWVQPRVAFNTEQVQIPASQVLHFHGWDPADPRTGFSPVSALKEILAEQVAANAYRNRLWERGPQISGVIKRGVDAPDWSDAARRRFLEQWRSEFSANGPRSGGAPLLEDGMDFQQVGFSAQDNQYVESAQLAFETICAVYHVNPALVGSSATTSYSNVKEFRKMLYGDTLGPIFEQISQRIDTFLLPMIGEVPNGYVEFNIQAKLAGNFEEQAASLQMSAGGPWMSVNEARALNNLPNLGEAYDQVITPLNVVRGGGDQASPSDSAPAIEDRTGPGDSQPEQQPKAAADELQRFFGRQYAAVASRLGSMEKRSIDDAWDEKRWNTELAAVMGPEASGKAAEINAATRESFAAALGADDWKKALKEASDARAATDIGIDGGGE